MISESAQQHNFWEYDIPVVAQEIACAVWNPNVHYSVHNSPPMSPVNTQTDSDGILLLILLFHPCQGLPN